MKSDSHMLKHFFHKHQEEELEDMKFGARIIRQSKSAFNRQISESVIIQNNTPHHHILNSKSEYNRCALPRLTAKLGGKSLDSLEKEKLEEKEQERVLLRTIRDLRVKREKKRGLERREPLRLQDQPAMKKRRITEKEYKRVRLEERPAAEKRKEEVLGEKMKGTRKTTIHPMFKNHKKKKIDMEEEEQRDTEVQETNEE